MESIIFFDVDTQYDFMYKNGNLYVPDAESIIPNLKKLTQFAKKKNISVVASIDHYVMNSLKIASKTFPLDCMNGIKVHKKIPETRLDNATIVPNIKLDNKKIKQLKKENKLLIEKQEHNAFSHPNLKLILKGTKRAYVYGVATDYCVKAAILELRNMKIETYVIKDAIKPVLKKNENKDLALFRKKGAKFLTTQQLLKRKGL